MNVRMQQVERAVNWVVGKPLAWALYGIGWAAAFGLTALARAVARWNCRGITPPSRS